MKEQRDQQIAELKALAEQTGETAQHDFEKKVSTPEKQQVSLTYRLRCSF